MSAGKAILASLRQQLNLSEYRKTHWEGGFEEYLDIVREHPEVTRTAYQRLYDMILSHGTEEVYENKEKVVRYKFFTEFAAKHADSIFGLDRSLTQLVNAFKSAAKGYGTERRVLLLHGPVGSSKSTIARLLKRGLEDYARTDEGMVFSFSWKPAEEDGAWQKCPMHEDPLHLAPLELRPALLARLNENRKPGGYEVTIRGDLCPFCRQMYNERMAKYDGDWARMLADVKVYRLILSEQDRIGIGTFQPKDEKNQDSTELTGDINYRKIAEYGTDSDPRAFNFDGELNIANRGLVEFIEVLKLDVAFLYDLLGASQEHKIKPKKFAQTDIDEVILGHSVSGPTPIPYRLDGAPGWTTLEKLYERFVEDPSGLEVLAHDFAAGRTCWTPVRGLFRHRFTGNLLTTSQKWGVVETTPNHSIYDRNGEMFYPEERREVMAVRGLADAFAPAPGVEVIDVLEGIAGFVRDRVRVTAAGGVMTRPCREGWARLDLPRHATAVRAVYDPIVDIEPLKDLITVLVWYATEGHVNGRNGGMVISQANRDELERVRAAYARITTGKGSIDAGAKTDSAWRLYLGSQAIAKLCQHHCGEHVGQQAAARLPVPPADGVSATRLRRVDAHGRDAQADDPAGRDRLGRLPREVLRVQDDLADAGRPGRHTGDAARPRLQRLPPRARGPRAGLPRALRLRRRQARRPAHHLRGPAARARRSWTSGSTTSSAPACTTSSAASATWHAATPTSRNIADCRTTNSWRRCATAR